MGGAAVVLRSLAGRRTLTALAFALAFAAPSGAAASPPGCHPEWPVVAFHADGAVVQTRLPTACATETGFAASETTIAATNAGALFFSPANTENSLARSLDQGASWSLSAPPKMQYTALWNTVDPVVTVDWRTGRLFWLRATGDLRTAPVVVDESPLGWQTATAFAYAHGFQVYSSPDDGRSWTTADYQHEFTGDWEKVFTGPPPPPSTGAAQPSGYPDVVYMCGNAPFEVTGPGRACYKSLDGGATFSIAGYVFPSPSAPSDFCPALAGNSGVVDSGGTTYQPQSCSNGTWVAVSRDEGASYSWLPVKGAPPANGLSGSVQLAIDRADNLYALWLGTDGRLELAMSRDHAQTWSTPVPVAMPGVSAIVHPALAAGDRGQVGVTYYGSLDKSAKTLTAYVTQTSDALDPRPLFYAGAINDPAHPIFQDYAFSDTPRADYVGGAFDLSGTFWAGVVKQVGAPDSNNNVPTTGYVGRLVFPAAASPSGTAAVPACVDRRKFSFRLHQPRHGRVVNTAIYVDGKLVLRVHRRRVTRVSLKRLPRRIFTVTIVATTDRGSRTVSVRRYRGCNKGRPHTQVHHHSRPISRP